MSRVLIVGGVAGGMSAATRLRRLSERAEIIVFERGEYVSFANCGLPYYIGKKIKDREELLLQSPESFKQRFNIDVRIFSEVIAINKETKDITVRDLKTGREYIESYDNLILSPGAEPFKPPILGIDHENIFSLRTVLDTDRIKGFIDRNNPKSVVILGGGYIGLEMAENLHARGIEVTIVEALPQLINILDYEMSIIAADHIREKGIKIFLEESVEVFEDKNGKVNCFLSGGKEIAADFVLLSIGVRPDVKLARECGLKIGHLKGIVVDEYLRTSNPEIYAIGDAIEVNHSILNRKILLPLAGPANKQGRIVADNIISGDKKKYKGSIGTSVLKVFDLTVAITGANEKMLRKDNIPYLSVIIHPTSHANYYPGAEMITLKLLFSPGSGEILGAQAIGQEGVEKRIDVISAFIQCKGTVHSLAEFEHCYAPPYSSAKDPINMAGFVAENILTGKVKNISPREAKSINKKEYFFLDVRTAEEFTDGSIEGAINIPVDELRQRLDEIPRDKKILIICRVGVRGYIASRILTQLGYKEVFNLSGGYVSFSKMG